MSGNFVDPQFLEDGNVLLKLKKEFIKDRKTETLYPVLNCLRDSKLIIPITPLDEEHFKPDIMVVKNGDAYLPIYSQDEQVPADYKKLFTFLPLPMEKCIDVAKGIEGLKGLVLDPYTDGMFITYDMTDIIMKMPSRLRPE